MNRGELLAYVRRQTDHVSQSRICERMLEILRKSEVHWCIINECCPGMEEDATCPDHGLMYETVAGRMWLIMRRLCESSIVNSWSHDSVRVTLDGKLGPVHTIAGPR